MLYRDTQHHILDILLNVAVLFPLEKLEQFYK
jgi:hypothetical protein